MKILNLIPLSILIYLFPFNSLFSQESCSLACIDHLTVMLNSEGTVELWAFDFIEDFNDCHTDIVFSIIDESGAAVIENSQKWTATEEYVDQELVVTIFDINTDLSCWGTIKLLPYDGSLEHQGFHNLVTQHTFGKDVPCDEIPIDFSSFSLAPKLEFINVSFTEIHQQVYNNLISAIKELYIDNGSSIENPGFPLLWTYSDQYFLDENSGQPNLIERKYDFLDWCHDGQDNTGGQFTFTQKIYMTEVVPVSSASIQYASDSNSLPVHQIIVRDDAGDQFIPSTTNNTNLKQNIDSAFESFQKEDGTYSLLIEKYEDCAEGISSLDLVLTIKHILDLQSFESATEIVAADFDENGVINVLDLVKMKNVVLGITDCNTDSKWRFYREELKSLKEIDLENLSSFMPNYGVKDEADINIIGIKKGDVNHSNNKKIENRSDQSSLYTKDIIVKSGKHYEIPIYANRDYELSSIDFKLLQSKNLEFKQISSNLLPLNENDYSNNTKEMKMVWFSPEPIVIEEGQVLFTLSVESYKTGLLSDILKEEMAQIQLYEEADLFDKLPETIAMIPRSETLETDTKMNVYFDGSDVHIHSNDEKIISSIKIYDMTGKMFYSEADINQSSHSIAIHQAQE